jgi:hypothetical protein
MCVHPRGAGDVAILIEVFWREAGQIALLALLLLQSVCVVSDAKLMSS